METAEEPDPTETRVTGTSGAARCFPGCRPSKLIRRQDIRHGDHWGARLLICREARCGASQ